MNLCLIQTIELFYNNIKQVFNGAEKLLKNKNYLDDTGNLF